MGSRNFMQPVYCTDCGHIANVAVPSVGSEVQCTSCYGSILVTSGEDVFISYSSKDQELATRIGSELNKQKIRFWLAPLHIDPGDHFPVRIEKAIEASAVVVVLATQDAFRSNWVLQELYCATERKKRIIAVRVDQSRLPEGWGLLIGASHHITVNSSQFDEQIRGVALDVAKTIAGEVRKAKYVPKEIVSLSQRLATGVNLSDVLFVGPRQYTGQFKHVFHGREAEKNDIIELLHTHRALAIVSPSGAGKSSLIAAGIKPDISCDWQVIDGARVGLPLQECAYRDVSNVFTFSAMEKVCSATFGSESVRRGETSKKTIAECLRSYGRDGYHKRLLVLDQFEEIFTCYTHYHGHREPFVLQLQEALRDDPELRILFALRKEYVVDLNNLMDALDEEFRPEQVVLQRIKNNELVGIINDIARPQARFCEGVVESLVDQLNTIRVLSEGGSVELRTGEYVELVHLQIVCKQLWDNLEENSTDISFEDLDAAARRAGKAGFSDFVDGALATFYGNIITAVAEATAKGAHGGSGDVQLSKGIGTLRQLIELGCRAFVTNEGIRKQLRKEGNYVGRLPVAVVNELADRFLLRTDSAGSGKFYELSHDLLAPIVAERGGPDAESLLYAADLLEKRLGIILQGDGSGFAGWFNESDELLEQCDPYRRAPDFLQENECELLLRASIASGTDLQGWSTSIGGCRPSVYRRVMTDALACPDEAIRTHAVGVLETSSEMGDRESLVDLLVFDPSSAVRRAACHALLRLDQHALFERVLVYVREPAHEVEGRRAAAILLAESDEMRRSAFHDVYDKLERVLQKPVRTLAWRLRFREAVRILPSILIVTAAFAGAIAASYKWLPGLFNWALVQKSPGGFMGVFHGLIAGTIWGGGISVGVAVHRLVFFRARLRTTTLQPFGAIVSGAVAGLVSSIVVVLVITHTYEPESLVSMGWVGSMRAPSDPAAVADLVRAPGGVESALDEGGLSLHTPARPSVAFYADLLWHTRMGWAHLILGTFVGIAIAATTNRVRAHPEWERFLADQVALENISQITRASKQIVPIVLPHLWPAVIIQTVGGVLVYLLVRPGPGAIGLNDRPVYGIIGDASTQVVGTLGAIVGLGVVTIIIRHGMVIKPRSKAQ